MKDNNMTKKYHARIVTSLLLSGLVLASLSVVGTANSSSDFLKINKIDADTVSSLSPGNTVDTGNHVYTTTDIANPNLWKVSGNALDTTATTDNFSTTLVQNVGKSAGLGLFQGALDMAYPISFSGVFGVTVNGGVGYKGNAMDAGDSLGFILTPESTDDIASNLENNSADAVGQYLGIGGLENSIFAGRDFYSNIGKNGVDNVIPGQTINNNIFGDNRGGADGISIRQTDASGKLITGENYAAAAAPDAGEMISDGNYKDNTISENMTFSWENPVVNSDGTITGTLVYSVTPLIPSQGETTTIFEKITVPERSLSLGVIGATGGNYSTMTFANNGSTFSAHKGSNSVKVNYIDEATGKTIADSSTIEANVGDTITVDSPTSMTGQTGENSYSYAAAKISGYDYAGGASVLVANNAEDANQINVYYSKIPVNTVKNVTINKEDNGNVLDSTTGYVQVSSSSSSATIATDDSGDTETTVTTTVIWHKPITTTTNVIKNVNDAGDTISNTDGYKLISTGSPVRTSTVAQNGDVSIMISKTNVWHKIVQNVVAKTVNVDEAGNALSDIKGYVRSSNTKKSEQSSTTANNGDITLTTINYVVWKKVVVTPKSNHPIKSSSSSSGGNTAVAAASSSKATFKPQVVSQPAKTSSSKASTTKAKTNSNTPRSSTTAQTTEKTVNSQQKKTKTTKSSGKNISKSSIAHAKFVHAVEVETAGIGGTAMGFVISGMAWTLLQRFLPAGFLLFIFGKKRKKDDDDVEK
ncbi:MucBP domain-containing protein [Lactococcus nasutitermitis]|nr:MucBP domain-containing protein [Lactococcus nasutitermitis]